MSSGDEQERLLEHIAQPDDSDLVGEDWLASEQPTAGRSWAQASQLVERQGRCLGAAGRLPLGRASLAVLACAGLCVMALGIGGPAAFREAPAWVSSSMAAKFEETGRCRSPPCDGPEPVPDSLVRRKPVGGVCTPPFVRSGEDCICPPPWIPKAPDSDECVPATGPVRMTFYMYRAQSDHDYPMENVNMGDLPGVMWYLHSEVVGGCPRKFGITRIMRFKVTMQTTRMLFKHWHGQFIPFSAFDFAKCNAHECAQHLAKYGAVVGCQNVDKRQFAYEPLPTAVPLCSIKKVPGCGFAKWYSLPGPCPNKTMKEKDDECIAQFPGGSCQEVTGDPHCTFHMENAGQIRLDELEGIASYHDFWLAKDEHGNERPNGNVEWRKALDRGIGMDFWDGRHDPENSTRRVLAAKALFKKNYPDTPDELPEPPCR